MCLSIIPMNQHHLKQAALVGFIVQFCFVVYYAFTGMLNILSVDGICTALALCVCAASISSNSWLVLVEIFD